jgi:hypothetical protein
VQQHPVEVQERTAATGAYGGDEVARFGTILRLVRDSGHLVFSFGGESGPCDACFGPHYAFRAAIAQIAAPNRQCD